MEQATADKIAKLPKWARDHITALERREARLRERLAEWEKPAGDADVQMWGVDLGKDIALPVSTVSMKTGANGDAIMFRRRDDGAVEVHSTGRRLLITPQAANAIVLRTPA